MVPLGESHTVKETVNYRFHSAKPIVKLTLLQLELLNTSLIGSDGSTLDTNTILLDGLSSVDGDLVIGLVTVLNTLGND